MVSGKWKKTARRDWSIWWAGEPLDMDGACEGGGWRGGATHGFAWVAEWDTEGSRNECCTWKRGAVIRRYPVWNCGGMLSAESGGSSGRITGWGRSFYSLNAEGSTEEMDGGKEAEGSIGGGREVSGADPRRVV